MKDLKKSRKKNMAMNAISKVENIQLAGFQQKVSIEGRTKDLPILVYLHGGPGFPFPFSVGSRGAEKEITDQFIFVCWDQLGCGINHYSITDDFKIDDFVKMAASLIHYLKDHFPDNKILIFGISWGSILAATLAAHHSHLLDSVIVYGQFVKEAAFTDEVYQELMASDLKRNQKNELKALFETKQFTLKNYKKVLGWLRKYTHAFFYKHGDNLSILSLALKFLESPDYRISDFFALFVNGYRKNTSLLIELMQLDLTTVLNQVKIPYYIIQGEYDINTSTKMVGEYMTRNENDQIHLQIISNSSHMPSKEALQASLEKAVTLSQMN